MALKQKVRTEIQSLAEAVSGEESVAVVIPDNTRPISYPEVIPPILNLLEQSAAETTVVVGNGLHREMTADELQPVRKACDRTGSKLLQHDASEPAEIVCLRDDVATGRAGWPTLPATVNRQVADADRVFSVGTVEPHQYAGFSGGAKGVAIGCGGEPTISAMHGLEFLRNQGTRLGATDGNPFQAAVWELADWLDSPLGLQIVPGTDQAQASVHVGSLRDAFDEAVKLAEQRFFEPYTERFDWLELDVPAEKSSNFYQASRAATYVGLVESPALVRGGTIVVKAACPEGIGQGSGERACEQALKRGHRPLIEELNSDRPVETRGGQQRAYVIAKTLEKFDIALVGANVDMAALDSVGIRQFDTMEAAQTSLGLGSNGRAVKDVFHAVPFYDGHSN